MLIIRKKHFWDNEERYIGEFNTQRTRFQTRETEGNGV